MATQEEILSLVTQVKGDAEVARLTETFSRLRDKLVDLNDKFAKGAISQATYERATQRLGSVAVDTQARMQAMKQGLDKQDQSFAKAASGVNAFNYKLMVMATTLDDMQYVGEMGLRPILNNLVMISPALGIAAIGFETVRKNLEGVKTLGQVLATSWGWDNATQGAHGFSGALVQVRDMLGEIGKAASHTFGGLGEGWEQLTGGKKKREQASIGEFSEKGSAEDRERGSRITKTIEDMGPAAIRQMIDQRAKTDPSLAGNPDRQREEGAKILELLKQAKEGKTGAIEGLYQRAEGTDVGATAAMNSPRAKAEQEEYNERAKINSEADLEIAQARIDAFKAKASEIAKGSSDLVGRSISGGFASGRDATVVRDEEEQKMSKRLLSTGQAGSKREADQLAQLAYQQIFEDTFTKIREKANARGISGPRAAAMVAVEQATEADRAHLTELKTRQGQLRTGNQGQADALGDRSIAASGVADPIANLMMMNRATLMDRKLKSSGDQRRFGQMTMEQREAFFAKGNAADDEQLVKQATRGILASGVTKDAAWAEGMARTQVKRQREALNGETGDQPLDKAAKATEDNTSEIRRLTDAMQRGVVVRAGA